MSTRRFELQEGSSHKFWEIEESGSSFTVRYGRMGTAGQSQTKTLGSDDEAQKAATKLIAEKTRKGYAEVSGAGSGLDEAAPAGPAPAPAAAAPAASAASAPASGDGHTIPAFNGPRAVWKPDQLTAIAAKLSAVTTALEWQQVRATIASTDQEAGPVIAHLILHHALRITHLAQLSGCEQAFYAAAEKPDEGLRILSALDEDIVPKPHRWPTFFSVFARILVRAPEQLATAELPLSLSRQALLARMLGGETLPREQALEGLVALAEALPNGRLARIYVAIDRKIQPVTPAHLLEALARNLGPHWIRDFAKSSELPPEVATPALEGESLEEVARALTAFNPEILTARKDSAARFFEVADTLTSEADANKALRLRLAGMERAEKPEDIPAHLEDAVSPRDLLSGAAVHTGFGHLGVERLDAWAGGWLERHPPALAVHDPKTPEAMAATNTARDLRLALFGGIPFGLATSQMIIGAPHAIRVVGYPTSYRVRNFLEDASRMAKDAAARLLPIFEGLANSDADPGVLVAYRLLAAFAIDAAPKDEVPDARFDELLVLGDAVEHDHKKVMRNVVARLPVARREAVIQRSRASLSQPASELEYAGPGASSAAMARFATVLVAARADDATWSRERTQSLKALGAEFGRHIVAALEGERASKSFLDELQRSLDPDAFAFVKANAGKPLDVTAELAQLASEMGGATVAVYLLSGYDKKAKATSLTRAGGMPWGFTAADVPKHGGDDLLHAFTVDLREVPELAERFPGARTLSFWIEPQGDANTVAQALLPRTDAEVKAHEPSGESRALTITRVMVPEAAFGDDPTGPAGYARSLVYRSAGFLLGGPLWLQEGPEGTDPEFIAQYDTHLAEGANFGDMGICYSFRTRATWQCH